LNPKIDKKTIYKEITHFQKELISSLQGFLKNQDPHPLSELFAKARKILKIDLFHITLYLYLQGSIVIGLQK